jgi:hypothetical protein
MLTGSDRSQASAMASCPSARIFAAACSALAFSVKTHNAAPSLRQSPDTSATDTACRAGHGSDGARYQLSGHNTISGNTMRIRHSVSINPTKGNDPEATSLILIVPGGLIA